jgi:ABC-type lipoprotein release transport system permease subunit
LVLKGALVTTVIGVLFGFVTAAIATKFIEGLLFGVTRLDLTTFLTAGAAFLTVSMFASLVPARRAARVDPLVALKYE